MAERKTNFVPPAGIPYEDWRRMPRAEKLAIVQNVTGRTAIKQRSGHEKLDGEDHPRFHGSRLNFMPDEHPVTIFMPDKTVRPGFVVADIFDASSIAALTGELDRAHGRPSRHMPGLTLEIEPKDRTSLPTIIPLAKVERGLAFPIQKITGGSYQYGVPFPLAENVTIMTGQPGRFGSIVHY